MNVLLLILIAIGFYFGLYYKVIKNQPQDKTKNYYLISSLSSLFLVAGIVYIIKLELSYIDNIISIVLYITIIYYIYDSVVMFIKYIKSNKE